MENNNEKVNENFDEEEVKDVFKMVQVLQKYIDSAQLFKSYDVMFQKLIKESLKIINQYFKITDGKEFPGIDENMEKQMKKLKENFKSKIQSYEKGLLKKPEKTIFILFGPSASGKTTIANKLENDMNRLITSTTREPREGEVDNEDYYFITEEEYSNTDFIEKPENYSNSKYGLSKKELERTVENDDKDNYAFVILTRQGINEMIENTNYDIRPVYITAKYKDIAKRLKNSNRTLEEKYNRLCDAIINWEYKNNKYTNIIIDTSEDDEESYMKELFNYIGIILQENKFTPEEESNADKRDTLIEELKGYNHEYKNH